MAVSPIDKVMEVLDYAVTVIPPDKIDMGIPNYGYDWKLPFEAGVTVAKSVGNEEALDIARAHYAEIEYSKESEAPFYYYYDADGAQHVVWFEDARSMFAKYNLIAEHGLNGCAFWNVLRPFTQGFLMAAILFNIERKR